MRLIPFGVAPFLYIAIFHLPFSYLGLTWGNVPQQLAIGIIVGIVMTVFAISYRIVIIGPWFRWPTLSDHFFQGFFYLVLNAPVEETRFGVFRM